MDINEQKRIFIDLLLSLENGSDYFEIKNTVLIENGLGNRTFWEVVCPMLQKEKILLHFDDPESDTSEFLSLIKDIPSYKKLYEEYILSEGNIEAKNHHTKKMADEKNKYLKDYKHLFNVNVDVIKSSIKNKTNIKEEKNNSIYTFSDNGKKPNGKIKIKGETILFKGMIAVILKYFFDISSSDYDYKTYKDFSESLLHRKNTKKGKLRSIDSNGFTKKINDINERFYTIFHSDIIERGETKKIEPNCYRLSKEYKK